MGLFPHFPLHLNSMALFGLILLLGLIGGSIAKKIPFIPTISGYIAIGFLVGPGGFNIASPTLLSTTHIFVEISLSLILFELGRHLDFRWLTHDIGLLPTGLGESVLTFIAIFILLNELIGLPVLHSLLGATIAVATSPAVVMMVANDLSAEGPVTRRTLILTSMNNLFALIIFTVMFPFVQNTNSSFFVNFFNSSYILLGSFCFGFIMFLLTTLLAYLIGKNKQNQFVLFVGMVILTMSFANIFNFSPMLVLFTLGICARNFDPKHILVEVDFGWFARLFFILLFVVTGIHLKLHGLFEVITAVFSFIFIRWFAKAIGIFLFSRLSHLTKPQMLAISLALTPMAGTAIGMSALIANFNPDFGNQLLLIITGVVAILDLVGPIATQLAFIKTGESLPHLSSTKEIQYNAATF